MSDALRLIGFEELSATPLRERLLARRAEFWAGSAVHEATVVALHDPLFFHQFGGFGALARTAGGDDADYLLGVVTADRLAVVHALAVHPEWRRRSVARRLVERFAGLAAAHRRPRGPGGRRPRGRRRPGTRRAVRRLRSTLGRPCRARRRSGAADRVPTAPLRRR